MSFRETLSKYLTNVQLLLFPFIENDVGPLSKDYKKLLAILELVRIEEFIPDARFYVGRPPKNRTQIARALIAKIVLKIPHTDGLINLLTKDVQLRTICGFEKSSKIPDKTVFSRAFKEFARIDLPNRVHQALISQVYQGKVVCHLIKDSTPIIAREKAPKKTMSRKQRKKLKDKELAKAKKEGRSRKQRQLSQSFEEMVEELPKGCDISAKEGTYGYKLVWKGYKLHCAVDDNCIPVASILTSASLNDSEVAIPLAEKCNRVLVNCYDLMDSAYDYEEVKNHSKSLGHVPIIDSHSRSKAQKAEKNAEAKRRKLLNIHTAEEVRYKKRFPKERFNALFKDYYGGKNIHYRGHSKIFCHLMIGVLSLTATMLIKLIE
jgi:hypothetical protein